MADPMIRLGDDANRAPVVRYDVPEPTTYGGAHYLELDIPETHFVERVRELPTTLTAPPPTTRSLALEALLLPARRGAPASARIPVPTTLPRAPRLRVPEEILDHHLAGGGKVGVRPSIWGNLVTTLLPPSPLQPEPRLVLVEYYSLTTRLGDYGAGRVIKTLSLLPGERTRLSIKTYKKTSSEAKEASSIFDSFSQESADAFEDSLDAEQSDTRSSSRAAEYQVAAQATATWGFGSASASGSTQAGTTAAREEFAKTVTTVANRHAQSASAKRDIRVEASHEIREEAGEELSIERNLENINAGRTLNFVFRQMNQEFVTVLHLVDIRIGFFNGFPEHQRIAPLPQVERLLREVIVPSKQEEIREMLLTECRAISDYRGVIQPDFIEERATGNSRHWRVNPSKTTQLDARNEVPGVVVGVARNVLRTDAVLVEAILGEGAALDPYAQELQLAEVRRRQAEATRVERENARLETLTTLAAAGGVEALKALATTAAPGCVCCRGHLDASPPGE